MASTADPQLRADAACWRGRRSSTSSPRRCRVRCAATRQIAMARRAKVSSSPPRTTITAHPHHQHSRRVGADDLAPDRWTDRIGRCAGDDLRAVQAERSERADQQERPGHPQQHPVRQPICRLVASSPPPRARSPRSGPAIAPLYRADPRRIRRGALPLTLSINAPMSNPARADLEAERSVDDVASSDGTRHTTTYTPLPIVGTEPSRPCRRSLLLAARGNRAWRSGRRARYRRARIDRLVEVELDVGRAGLRASRSPPARWPRGRRAPARAAPAPAPQRPSPRRRRHA